MLAAVLGFALAACTGSASTTTQDPKTASTESEDVAVDRSSTSTTPIHAPEPMPDEEIGDFLVRCYAEYGIVARNLADETEVSEGSGAIAFPGDQPTEARQEAGEACTAAAMAAGLIINFDDPDQVRAFYREAVVPFYECLIANDYPVPDLPSEEIFVQAPLDWDPYALMGTFTPIEASKACNAPPGFGVLDLRGVDVSE